MNFNCNILSWNINGVKEKFHQKEVMDLFNSCDILLLNETHFNIRAKCPDGFVVTARSIPSGTKAYRGGVAVYTKTLSKVDIEVISKEFLDCIIFLIKNIDLLCIAYYITPNNSKYFNENYFTNLRLFLNQFKDKSVICIGDLNARVGTPEHRQNVAYQQNPDPIINQNGKELLNTLKDNESFYIVNGIQTEKLQCSSEFTFFRGNTRSQNDICITNDINKIKEMTFEKKLVYSDHRPVKVTVSGTPVTSLDFVNECAISCFNDDHYDISRKLNNPIKLRNLDLCKLVQILDDPSSFNITSETCFENLTADEQCSIVTGGIYNAAKQCKIKHDIKHTYNENINISENCTFSNYKAIADANFKRYQDLVHDGKPAEDYMLYLETWKHARELACQIMKKDSNKYIHKSWTDMRFDPKKLWDRIDWKGKKVEPKPPDISLTTVNKHFTNIFNSNKIEPLPTSEASYAIQSCNNNMVGTCF